MSFERIVSDRPITLYYKKPGDRHPDSISFQTGIVQKVPTDVFGALLAKKNDKGPNGVSPVESFLQAGILKIVANDRADPIIGTPPVAQQIAEALGKGQEPKTSGTVQDTHEDVTPAESVPQSVQQRFRGLRK